MKIFSGCVISKQEKKLGEEVGVKSVAVTIFPDTSTVNTDANLDFSSDQNIKNEGKEQGDGRNLAPHDTHAEKERYVFWCSTNND